MAVDPAARKVPKSTEMRRNLPRSMKLTRQVTMRQAASHCQVVVSTLRRWIETGALRAIRTPGGHHRIEIEEFQRFLREQGIPPYSRQPLEEAHILIVDDDRDVIDLVIDVLTDDPRAFKLEAATDGFEALVKVGFFRPSLLILDVSMPGMDGVEVCRRLKTQPETRAIRVLGITGHPEKVSALMKAGADGCLAKPLSVTNLRQEVSRLLSARTL
jgi:excisionase family DNA binding protein